MYRAGSLVSSKAKCFPDVGGNHIAIDNLFREFGDGSHHVNHVDDLETSLFVFLMGFCPVIIIMGMAPNWA
jgi:hypothetical protein